MWDARNLTSIAERIIETEEDGMVDSGFPAEEKRVHDAQWGHENLDSTAVQKVTFFLRQLDDEGQEQWEFREEMIPWR